VAGPFDVPASRKIVTLASDLYVKALRALLEGDSHYE
jgi:hypothetical protein